MRRAIARPRPVPLVTVGRPEPAVEAPDQAPADEPERPASRTIEYVVQKNDSLWAISKKCLGSGEKWRAIARENDISTSRPELKPGMRLRITIPAQE